MKVLFVCHVYPRHGDDHQASFMHDLARIAARTHDVVVLAPHDAGLAMEEVRDGVRIVRFRYAPDRRETLAYRGDMHEQVLRRPARALLFWRFLRAWRRAVRQAVANERPDVVHIHWWVPGGLVAAPVCRRLGVPYVVSSHGTDVFLLRKAPPARRWARRVFAHAGAVHAVSSAIREDIARHVSPADAARTRVFTMPVDLDAMAGVRRRPVAGRILFVGRLVERKGAHVLIDAFRRVLRVGGHVSTPRSTPGSTSGGAPADRVGAGRQRVDPPHPGRPAALSLHIVGDGPQRPQVQALAAGVAEISVLGPVSRARLRQEYAQASVFCLPSLTTRRGEAEGLGVVLLEAMAAGVPVVATRSGGIVDAVVDGETGLLVEEGDPDALAAALERVLGDPALARRLAGAAKRRLARFGEDAVARHLAALYAECQRASGGHGTGAAATRTAPRAEGP